MKLTRLHVEQFKRFRQPVELRDLEPGLNLFTGPNETGKSTLVAAIRAAFFERHRSSAVDELLPWGDSAAAPTVELDFETGGQHYRLSKRFLHKKRCELQFGSTRLDGDEAEGHLSKLLGFQYAGRGASQAEHWGIPGLLWIEQGSAQDIHTPVANATDHLRRALNESLGEVASSGGDDVLASVEAARNELLTASTGNPRGVYAEAIKREGALGEAIRELDNEITLYSQKVDSLAALRRAHAADEADKPWVGFRAQEKDAVARLDAIQGVERQLRDTRQQAAQLDEKARLLRDRLDGFARDEKDALARSTARDALGQQVADATQLVAQWKTRHAEAATRYASARDTLRLARQEDTRRGLARQLEELRLKADNSAATLARAEAEQASLRSLQQQAAATEIADADLAALRAQHRQIHEIRIRQEASATRLHFALDDGRSLRIGDETVSGSGERQLLDATSVHLPGLGRLDIAPGGNDLASLRHAAADLAGQHADLLQRLGLASLDAAEDRYQTNRQLAGDIRAASGSLKALAPRGLEALRSERDTHEARARDSAHALAQLPPAPDTLASLPGIAAAESAEDAAKHALDEIRASLSAAELAAGNAHASLEAAERELSAARALLDAADRAERLTGANRSLTDTLAEQRSLQETIDALTRQVSEASPDFLRQDVERYRRSAEQHEKSFNQRATELLKLDIELQSAGAKGLDERRAEMLRDHAQASRRAAELARRAAALDHLLKLLKGKRRDLTLRLQAPLQKYLNRYLQLLFPGASLEIDENLSPGPLTRKGASGPESGDFEALSFGAREQMGVISRLAYADLLKEAGRPTLIILDDALVHSDAARLAQMKRVLFDAATRHQILLFSCHPENWRDLGVSAHNLDHPGA
jgi:DNA repair exonuclease SbcCD ATPase subunit